jgi:metal-responsive CopG/Arc/MetJ family transcriptional regulator
MVRTAQQVSVSLPADIVEWLDYKAERTGSSRSQLLAEVLD